MRCIFKTFTLLLLLIAVGSNSTTVAMQASDEISAIIKLAQLKQAEELGKEFSSLYKKGQYADALKLAREVWVIHKSVFGVGDIATAGSISDMAMVHNDLSDYESARRFYRLELKIRESAGGKDRNTAICLGNLAGVHRELGDFLEAKKLYFRAIKIEEKIVGADHPSVAVTLGNLSQVHIDLGEYSDAQVLLKRVLMIQKAKLGEQHRSTANTLNTLGLLFKRQGNLAEAEQYCARSVSVLKALLSPNDPSIAIGNSNLASVYQEQKKFSLAQPLLAESLEIISKRYGNEHALTATCLNNLATCYDQQQNFDKAIPLHKQVLAIRKKKFGFEHPLTAATLINLGLVYKKQGRFDEAKSICEQGMEIYRRVVGEDHPLTIASAIQVAILETIAGNTARGLNRFEQLQRASRRHVTGVLPVLSPAEQVAFLDKNYSGGLFAAISLAVKQADDSEVSKRSAAWLINGKAIAHEAAAQRSLLAKETKNPKLASVAKRLLRAREKLAKFALEETAGTASDQRNELIDKAKTEERSLSEQLGRASLTQIQTESWVELNQVKQALSKDAVFIDFFRFDELDFEATNTNDQWLGSRYGVWISHPGRNGKTVSVDLGSADEIEAMVAQIRNGIASASQREGSLNSVGELQATEAINVELKNLAEKLWAPIQPHLDKSKKLVVSPDGALWLVPWGALPAGADAGGMLIEEYALRLIVSGRDLVSKREEVGKTREPILMANPNFDLSFEDKLSVIETIRKKKLPAKVRKKPSPTEGERWLPTVGELPMTSAEAKAVLPRLQDYLNKGVLFLERDHALEVMVKSFPQPEIACFATHGFFLKRNQAPEIANPLLRCGLLFSGSNDPQSVVAEDDGVLTGLEIVSLDYRGTKLVVLSACETGVGDVGNGEGVAGLRQAFQLAGAESVVASLWQVDDTETARLMNLFFENLAAGKTKSESLRQAQLTRIKARRARHGAAHPFFWAAFTLTGQD